MKKSSKIVFPYFVNSGVNSEFYIRGTYAIAPESVQ